MIAADAATTSLARFPAPSTRSHHPYNLLRYAGQKGVCWVSCETFQMLFVL